MEQSTFDVQAEFCKAMGHPVRLQILHILRETPLNVGRLAEQIGLPPSLVSHQLNILRLAGVVSFERHGPQKIYQLADSKIGEVCNLVQTVLVEHSQRHSHVMGK